MASVVRSKDGRWRAHVRRAGFPAKSRIFNTKQEAQRWARSIETQFDDASSADPMLTTTVGEVIEAYTTHVMKPTATRSKQGALRALSVMLGKTRLAELTPQVLTAFATKRQRQGAGPATIGMDFSFLGTALRHGAGAMGISEAIATPLMALATARSLLSHSGRIGASRQRDRRPTEAELADIREALLCRPRVVVPTWDIALFAIATAMRLGEITRIRWEDVDVAKRTVIIRQRKHPQTKRDTTIPLLSGHTYVLGEVVDPLSIMQRQRTRRGRVFPYADQSISRAWARATEDAGVDDLTFHDLRHDGVSRLFEAGYTIEQVALVSGHLSWSNLKRYTQIKPESLHRVQNGANKQ